MRRIAFVAVLIAIVGVVYFVFFKLLVVDGVECSTQFGNCRDRHVQLLGELKGASLFAFGNVAGGLLEKDLVVSEYEIRYVFPRGFSVYLIEGEAEIAVHDGKLYHLFDAEGRFLGTEEESGLPAVLVKGTVDIQEMSFGARLAREIVLLYPSASIEQSVEGIFVEIQGLPKMIFPTDGDVDVLLGSATLVLSRLSSHGGTIRIENEDITPSEIDFRSDNPVLR